ncbi:uncharacterized protein LOC131806900 isoform X3 [Musca domestica]|uniref:Uncharacterized protein LOC131806900 isoform X3 n=1 Tax=Musca domestica TaxID=7370 RepID=A0ABM3VPL7_MUSDO|nr:uncharacterized protein LOC131806900 isoform X3 [Musca domestica]
MASQELFPEVVLSDYDDAVMSDRELEAELRATNPNSSVPDGDPVVELVPTTSAADIRASISEPSQTVATAALSRVRRAPINSMVLCLLCTQPHALQKCSVFRRMALENRIRTVTYHRCCYNCLRPDHVSKFCQISQRCKFCTKKHHTLLHEAPRTKNLDTAQRTHKSIVPRGTFPVPPRHVLPTLMLPIGRIMSLFPTVVVRLCLPKSTVAVRALLDPCCPVSQVCVSLVNDLRWPTTSVNHMTYADFMIMSRFDPSQRQFVTASVANITRGVTPSFSAPPNIRDSFVGLELADPNFDRAGPIAMVLGPEIYHKIVEPRVISNPGLPTAIYTKFGWIISGPVPL